MSLDGFKGIAYLSSRKNFNDVTEITNFTIGQKNNVFVKQLVWQVEALGIHYSSLMYLFFNLSFKHIVKIFYY